MPRMRFGENPHLEAEANRILRESLRHVTSHSAKKDILTEWKEQDRRSREVYSGSGVVDPATRRGMFGRVLNPDRPHLNARDGVAGDRARSLGQFVNDA